MKIFNYISSFLIILSIGFSEQLDPRLYRAWSVEYDEYWLLVQREVKDYINLHPDNLLPMVRTQDKVIIVQSQSKTDQIYQLWYGRDGHYTVIKGDTVKYVLGRELRKLLVEKHRYFYIDNKAVFYSDPLSRSAAEFIPQYDFWANDDVILSTNKLFFKLPFSSDFALSAQWGNTLINSPYSISKSLDLSIVTRTTQIGLKLPFKSVNYPGFQYVDGDISTIENNKALNSTLGGFGRCKIGYLNGFFGFNNPALDVEDIAKENDQNSLFVSDYYMLVDGGFSLTKENYIVPTPKVTLHPGYFYQRVTNYNVIEDELVKEKTTVISSLSLRLEFRTPIKRKVPLIEGFIQAMPNYGASSSVTVNFTRFLGLKLDATNNFKPNEFTWIPENSIHVGMVMRIKFKTVELPK